MRPVPGRRHSWHRSAQPGLHSKISDPYEPPQHPAVRIDTTDVSPEEAAQQIFLHLEKEGYIGAAGP